MDDEANRRARRAGTPEAGSPHVLRLHHADDVVEAVPYLLGFRPRDSVVLVGIEGGPGPAAHGGGRVRITVRMDIADLCAPAPDRGRGAAEVMSLTEDGSRRAAAAILRSGATAVVGVVFVDDPQIGASADEAGRRAARACVEAGLELGDLLVVVANGAPVGVDGRVASRVAAEATYAGLVARRDRDDVVQVMNPDPAAKRVLLSPALDAEFRLVSGSDGEGRRRRRGAIRALFAATRTLAVVDESRLVRFGAALRTIEVRDACWLAGEAGRLDGEALWRELGRRLPAPYDASALFLFGWQRWRHGDGVLAGIAARQALDSDGGYSAAGLLEMAVNDGLDPFRTPRLRKGA